VPRTPFGELTALPHSLAGLRGTLLIRGRGEKQRGGERGQPPQRNFLDPLLEIAV